MKRLLVGISIIGLMSCESSVTVDYNTIKAKNIILKGEDDKEYQLKVHLDSIGNPSLKLVELK